MANESTVSSDPNSSLRRSTDPNQNVKSSVSSVLSPTQMSSTPPSKSDSLQKSLVLDKTQIIREERRKKMRSMGIHVVADNDDQTVYELPVVIKKTKSRRRVHKLKWKAGVVDPEAKSETESTSDSSYRVVASSYVTLDIATMTPLELTVLAMTTYLCLVLSTLFKLIDGKLGIGNSVENGGEKKDNEEEKKTA